MTSGDMVIDKAIYKRFTTNSESGTYFELVSKNYTEISHEKKEVGKFIAKTKGELCVDCYYNYHSGSIGEAYFDIYVDDNFVDTVSVSSTGGNPSSRIAKVTVRPLSTIKVMASADDTYNVSRIAYAGLSGYIIDDAEQFIIEVSE